ncbi:GIY-YIG nuclease family protein [Corynebacterium sp. Q4381]|uniref:GIY-YIG nuclease family protein n=1 Tax=Corynebacterium sp. Marseille-Q4381 TaxID=3121597 RepID=UPI002FE67466
MAEEAFLAKLDALIAADEDGLLDMPEKPLPVTETDRLRRAFLEVNEFVSAQGREPDPETMNISERKFGARLVGIRASKTKTEALSDIDEHGLLEVQDAPISVDDLLSSDALDLLGDAGGIFDTSSLPKRDKPKESERELRRRCEDFDKFEPLFKQKHAELADGTCAMTEFKGAQTVVPGAFFILRGLMAFIAEVRESEMVSLKHKEERKERLRVIFENGTESAMYRQSFGARMGEQGGFAITRTGFTAAEIGDADLHTGFIYVLRSKSDHPDIRGLKDLYKIGFSTTPVDKRIRGAEKSPTYLMAPVEKVAIYRVYSLRPSALEHLLHRLFAAVRLDAAIVDEAGGSVAANEWFLVPLDVINRAIELIMSGEIVDYTYDPSRQQLVKGS